MPQELTDREKRHQNIIQSNRKFLKKLINSDASVFCFFRLRTSVKNFSSYSEVIVSDDDKKYDTLEIIYVDGEIILKLKEDGKEDMICKTFKFFQKPTDETLYNKLETELKESGKFPYGIAYDDEPDGFYGKLWVKYYQNKPDAYLLPNDQYYFLDEIGIASFIQLSSFDCNNYFKFYRKEDFLNNPFKDYKKKRKESSSYDKGSVWKVIRMYGLVLKERWYSQRYSDFGSSNVLTALFADQVYFPVTKNKIFYKYSDPSDVYPIYGDFWKEVYDYFYNDKKMILLNFDEMELDPRSKVYQGKELTFEDKLFSPPSEYINESFILTVNESTDIEKMIRDNH